jgi:hypothetical protein
MTLITEIDERKNREYWTVEAMLIYGGSFVKALAKAFQQADSVNFQKLVDTFSEYWVHYEGVGKELEKQKNEV